MQVQSNVQTKAPAQTIPSHVIERLESEWRQVRQPTTAPSVPSSK